MILSCLFIADSPGRGRGVFTNKDLTTGKLIEVSPVIVMNNDERKLLDQTLLHDYIFLWGKTENECCVGLGYLSIYNHDFHSNAEYEMDFELSVIRIKTVRNIKKAEEIFINYNGSWNDSKPLWFDPVKGLK
ncbi:MAG TPA: SET domain-containing protein-lysine N-methyltransferase [Puia sp.]|nr:SET domain-containing protein-lysine N-methyltransferase [Puia sp.]